MRTLLAPYLTRDAKPLESPSAGTVSADRLVAHLQYTSRYAWIFWRALPTRSLADHAPINYARAIFPQLPFDLTDRSYCPAGGGARYAYQRPELRVRQRVAAAPRS